MQGNSYENGYSDKMRCKMLNIIIIEKAPEEDEKKERILNEDIREFFETTCERFRGVKVFK